MLSVTPLLHKKWSNIDVESSQCLDNTVKFTSRVDRCGSPLSLNDNRRISTCFIILAFEFLSNEFPFVSLLSGAG